MSLLPSEPDTSAAEDSDPRVIGVDSDAADDLIAALSSDTAREILAALHDDPAPPSELAEGVDTSLQNVQYHLDNLAEAGAVEVIDTVYSEKGREMDVYAPADRPLVIFAGEESRTPSLRQALSRLLGGVGALALASLVVQSLLGDGLPGSGGPQPVGDGAVNATTTATEYAASGDVAQTTMTIAESDAGIATETATRATEAATQTATQSETAVESATQTATQSETAVETATQTATQSPTPAETVTPTRTPTETMAETIETVTTVAPDGGGLPPGLLFFAGGLTALVIVSAVWYLWR
ncbi:ArsR/SmtB family transcription factor [Halorhabdus salina]|uniref:ArsR/SmtB family transcription factor n=1 Tax=Halorhabdus salina TaxID=2750670 RepID=UPI0015EF4A87|nr:winged helix-turn-helix domain-containing protein [Halorhabdus salina]